MKLPSLQGVHVVVVGDVMLDRYWSGMATRVSQEAPVPVVNVELIDNRPGGAANVALNVVSLGARATLLGVVGDDEAGRVIRNTLEAAGVICDFTVLDGWSTTLKLRILSQKQQLLRTDFESPLPESAAEDVARRLNTHLSTASTLVVQDYDKGAVHEPRKIIENAQARGVPVVVDPKNKPFSSYAGASVLKPNETEFAAAVGPCADDDELVEKARLLCRENGFEVLVVTRGARGMTVVEANGEHQHLPALSMDVFDVTGAGDTAAAALGITRGLGWGPGECARVANVAAGIAVGKSGTVAVSGPELGILLRGDVLTGDARADRGILSETQLLDSISRARSEDQRIVFTNGCFDILHAGHVAYLEEARALGDRLVVAVNNDASVARIKGEGRPVNPLARRMQVLSGLAAVDWVVPFAEDSPEELLEKVQPDVLVKGGDYKVDEVVGADIVRSHGGVVRVLGFVEDVSTSDIINTIRS